MFKHTRSPSMEDAKPPRVPTIPNRQNLAGPPAPTRSQVQNRRARRNGGTSHYLGESTPLSQRILYEGSGSTFSVDPPADGLGYVNPGNLVINPPDSHQHALELSSGVFTTHSNFGGIHYTNDFPGQDSGCFEQSHYSSYPATVTAPSNESIPAFCESDFGLSSTMSPQQIDFDPQSQLENPSQLPNLNLNTDLYNGLHAESTLESSRSSSDYFDALPEQETSHRGLWSSHMSNVGQQHPWVNYGAHQPYEHNQAQNSNETYLDSSLPHANSTAVFTNDELSYLLGHAAGESGPNALRSGVPQQIHTTERVPATGQSKKWCEVEVRRKKDVKKEGKRKKDDKNDGDRNDADKADGDNSSVVEADDDQMAGGQKNGGKNQAVVKVPEPCGRKLDPDSNKHCRRHHIKYVREHAPTPDIPYLEGMTYAHALAMAYPVYPGPSEPLEENHCIFKPSDHNNPWDRADGEDHWTQRFLNAAMDAVNPTDLFEQRQQKVFNGNFAIENKPGDRYTIEWINARIRMLYQVAYVVENGGHAVYPKGGDNHGYGSREKFHSLEARLARIEEVLTMRKLIVRNVIEGRGVVAFVENPSVYTRRKRQNKESNERKDQRLKAKRPQKRRRAEDVEDTDCESGEEHEEEEHNHDEKYDYNLDEVEIPELPGAYHGNASKLPTNRKRKRPETTEKSKKATPSSGPKRPIKQTRRKRQKTEADGSP